MKADVVDKDSKQKLYTKSVYDKYFYNVMVKSQFDTIGF